MSRVRTGRRSSAASRVVCPIDEWEFEPRYTDGACPLCGWRPPGPRVEPPVSARVDWFWPMAGVLVVLSIVMGILVLVAYARA